MEIVHIILIVVATIVAGMFIYMMFFRAKGRRVYVEFYEEMKKDSWYRIDPHETYKGLLYRDQDGVEKLKIPKKFSKVPIEAVNIDSLIPSSTGKPIVMLAKDAEQLFRPMNCMIDDKKTFRAKVEQREPLSWLFQEKERTDQQYASKNKWAQYAAVMTLGIIIMGGLLTVWVTADKINELNDDYRAQVLKDTQEQKSWVVDLVNNINPAAPDNVEPSENAEVPPQSG